MFFIPVFYRICEAFDACLGELREDWLKQIVHGGVGFVGLEVFELIFDKVDVGFYIAIVISSDCAGFDDIFDALLEGVFAGMYVITYEPEKELTIVAKQVGSAVLDSRAKASR